MEVALDPRDDALVACVRGRRSPHEPARSLESSRLLAALRHAGTSHVYADTADVAELAQAVATPAGRILAEVDGNTVNQPLVGKVVDRYRDADGLAACASAIGRGAGDAAALRYAVVCGWIGQDVVRAFASGRRWEVSLQLHMGLGRDGEASKWVACSGGWCRRRS